MFKAQKYKKVSTLNIIFQFIFEMRDPGYETRIPKHETHLLVKIFEFFS